SSRSSEPEINGAIAPKKRTAAAAFSRGDRPQPPTTSGLLIVGGQLEQSLVGAVRLVRCNTKCATNIDGERTASAEHSRRARGIDRHAVDADRRAPGTDEHVPRRRSERQADRLASLAEPIKPRTRKRARDERHAASRRPQTRVLVDRNRTR